MRNCVQLLIHISLLPKLSVCNTKYSAKNFIEVIIVRQKIVHNSKKFTSPNPFTSRNIYCQGNTTHSNASLNQFCSANLINNLNLKFMNIHFFKINKD